MLVRNNRSTPCCGKLGLIELSTEKFEDDYICLLTCCRLCGQVSRAALPIIDMYEIIRKGSILFPQERNEFEFSRWPVAGPALTETQRRRVSGASMILLDQPGEWDISALCVSMFSELAWEIQRYTRWWPMSVTLIQNRPSPPPMVSL